MILFCRWSYCSFICHSEIFSFHVIVGFDALAVDVLAVNILAVDILAVDVLAVNTLGFDNGFDPKRVITTPLEKSCCT